MTTTRTPIQHGERRCYLRGCQRDECAEANRRYCKRYRTTVYVSGPRRVDNLQPYTSIVTRYLNHGWSYAQIANLAGCCETVPFNLHKGISKRINQKTAEQLATLPTTPPPVPGHGFVDPTGTVRRGQALYRIGHTLRGMAPELDIDPDSLSRTLNRPAAYVYGSTAAAMTDLYNRWQNTPGPSTANRNRAEARGWPDPTWWEDMGHIDDPTFDPRTVVERPMNRLELAAYRRDEIDRLNDYRIPDHEIADRLGMGITTVRSIIAELESGQRRDRKQAA
ncbi:hypothetical protein SGL43_06630 [Streptomyces globisporus]|uniref:Uncharacterized protein n=1 Tax=Streptomyces globisporus TaxID=1908 RepID=A0ABN8V9V1_STRGL|nr:hypothetical protein [Streptomyces globisporus]CAH9419575.1 hypothetical protein SGL43_06630 [Streptomyces globisporus]